MKKIYTLITVLAFTTAVNAQNKAANLTLPKERVNHQPKIVNPTNRALGDTVYFFNGNNFYGTGISSTSTPAFNYANDDIDLKTVNTALTTSFGPTSAFKFFYSLNSVTSDSVFFLGATSWFTPAGQADNWFEVGPIAIPAAGATLSWKHNMPDGAYRDGYKVLVSTTGLSNYTDFTNPAIYTVTDQDPTTVGDTVNSPDDVFVGRTIDFSAYAGQSIYLAFNHDGNDMFILYLTDFLIKEGPMGVKENEFVNGVRLFQNTPNPFNSFSTVNYELKEKTSVLLSVYDVTGKKIAEQNEGEQVSGTHSIKLNAADLSAGVYYYSLTVGNNVTACKKMVVIK